MTDFLVKRFIKNSTDVNDPAVRTAYGNLAGAVGIFFNVLIYLPLVWWLWKAPFGPKFRKGATAPRRALRGFADIASTLHLVIRHPTLLSMTLPVSSRLPSFTRTICPRTFLLSKTLRSRATSSGMPTIVGMPISRATIAECERMLPRSMSRPETDG